AWIERAQPPFPAQFIRREHATAAAARNAGLERIGRVPWVAFLDSDDVWPEDFLERTTRMLERHPEAVAVSGDRLFRNAEGQMIRFDDCAELASNPVSWFFQHGAGIASASLLRVSAVAAVGNWDVTLDSAEDVMLFARIALEGRWLHAPGLPVEFF